MAVFEIERGGKVYEIEAPDQAAAFGAFQTFAPKQEAAPADPQLPAESAFEAAARRTRGATIRRAGMGETALQPVIEGAEKALRVGINSATFGLADRFAGGMDALTGAAPSYDEGVKAHRAKTEAIRKEMPVTATAAEIAGGVATGAALARGGISLAARAGPGLLPRTAAFGAEGALYGAAHGAGNTYSDKPADYVKNAFDSAKWGAGIGAAMPVAGSALGGAYRLGSAFVGPRVEGAGRGASAMLRSAAQADEVGLRGLPGMGQEAMLPDAGPALLGLAQGAGTGTGHGRTELVRALMNRDAGTGQRLASELDRTLGPAQVPSKVETGFAANRKALGPEYERAFAGSKAVNLEPLALEMDYLAITQRGAAQDAAKAVRQHLNVAGTDQLERDPRTLLAVRQSIDGMLDGATDGNVRRVLSQARKAVDDELKASVPGIKAIDAKYAQSMRESEALERGQSVFDTGKNAVRPVELADEMAGMSGAEVSALRQGARADLDRRVGTNINDLNTLERALGTPSDWNAQKLGVMFGQNRAEAVANALRNNRVFRDTYQKVVQNSQTAQRTSAANAMEGAAGGNVPGDLTMTGLGLRGLNALVKALSGANNATTKDEIGRLLARQGPDAQRLGQELLRTARATGTNAAAIARAIANPSWISGSAPVYGRK